MNGRWTPEELDELLGAYALDALDADEAAAVERHLRDDPRAREEVDRHREVAALLGSDGAAAPEGLWNAITNAIATDEDAPAPTGELARVLEIPPARRRSGVVVGALAAVAAGVAVVLGVQVVRLDDELDDVRAALDESGSIAAATEAALADPASTKVELTPPAGPGPSLSLAVAADGQGYLDASALPALDADRTYQLWAITGDTVISAGVLGAEPGAVAFRAVGAEAFAVTVEDAPGVVATAQDPLLVGTIA